MHNFIITKKDTINTMCKVMKSILMQLIPLMQVEQKVIKMLLIMLQHIKILHLTKHFLDKWF